jgi:hypothetical protein
VTIPPREAVASLLLLLLLVLAVLLTAPEPGPGPLALCTSLAALHAALLAPSLAAGAAGWGILPLALAWPALCATSYGHPGVWPVLGSLLLVALAALAGAAARRLADRPAGRLYLPFMVLVFAAPYALRYLVLEFGRVAEARAWLLLSPAAAAEQVAAGGALPAGSVLLLLVWPVCALARRGA